MDFRVQHMAAWAERQQLIAAAVRPGDVARPSPSGSVAPRDRLEGDDLVREALALQYADLVMGGELDYRDAVHQCRYDGLVAIAKLRLYGWSTSMCEDFNSMCDGCERWSGTALFRWRGRGFSEGAHVPPPLSKGRTISTAAFRWWRRAWLNPSDGCFYALAAAIPSFYVAAATAATATAVTSARRRQGVPTGAMPVGDTRPGILADPCMPPVREGGACSARRSSNPAPWMSAP
jgi:hypothetical protein